MPKFKDRFLNLTVAMLPIIISGVFFSQIISTNMEMKNKFQDILGASTAGLIGSAPTDGAKIGIISGIIDSIIKLDDKYDAHFNKIKISGRISEPDLLNLEKDQSFIWLDQDMDRIFLSRYGVDRIEVLTDEFFSKDLTFKKSLQVNRNVEIGGNLEGQTATLSSAYISGDLRAGSAYINGYFSAGNSTFGTISSNNLFVNGYFSAGSSSLGTTTINGNLSAALGSFTNLGVTTDLSAASARFTNLGVTSVISAANGNFTTRLGVNGAFSASSAIISGLFSGDTASFTGNVSMGSAQIGNITVGNNSESKITYNGLVSGSLALSSPGSMHIFTNTGIQFWSGPSTKIAEFGNASTDAITFFSKVILSGNNTLAARTFSNPTENNLPLVVGSGPTTFRIGIGPSVSDERLKSNTQPATNSIGIIKQLHPVTFNLRDFSNLNQTQPDRQIGLVAQEVEKIFPYLVTKDVALISGTWYKGLDYGRLTAVLLGGMQEQQGQIETLSNAIGTLNLSSLQSLYNQFNSALQNLSMSVENGKLIINSGLTVAGEALFNNASFTGNVEVGQVKIDSLENDINIDASSCVDMDGNTTSNCDTNKLNVMKNKAGNVEMFDGKVKFKPNGEVLGEKVQAKTFKNSSSSAPATADSCNSGEFKFAEDNGKAFVFFCTSNSEWVRSELSRF